MIVVRVLGPVTAELAGRPVDLGSPQRRAVLARLAVAAGAVVSTDRLIDDLWGTEPPPRALAGLQAHVSHLRRVLEPDRPPRTPASVLVSAAPGYALRIGDGLDAARAGTLRRRAATEDPATAVATLREALALWTGPVLAELADLPWAGPEIARLEDLRADVVEALATAEIAADGGDRRVGTVDLLTGHVREHPLREEAVRLLAVALYRAGRSADALAAVAELRRRLADDLGLDPSPALGALEHGILTHTLDTPAPVAVPAPDPEPTVGPDPVVGRDPELARLADAAARARRRGALVLVGGEAGAGKTTLVEEFTRRLEPAWRVVRGRCPEVDGAPPAWAWTEVGDALAVPPPDDGPHRAFRAGRALLTAFGAVAPIVVVLDDLHRADDETLRLLRAVVGAAAPGVLVVATLRPSEVGDGLAATLASLAGGIADRVDVAGLPPAAVADLLARHGDGADWDPAAVTRRTGGNPLFVREVARLARTVGVEAASSSVPSGVGDVLRRRVAALPAAAGSVLRRAAVVGGAVDVALLIELEGGGDPEERVLTALEGAVLAGLVVEVGPDRVRFAHDLVRETLRDDVPRLRRARMHAAVLTVLERTRPDDRLALAHHALAAGPVAGVDRVLDHATAAAADARRAQSPRTAADLLTTALPLAADPRRRVGVRVALASALAHAGAIAPALEQRAAAITEAAGLPVSSRVAAVTCVDAPVSFALAPDGALDRTLVDAAGALLDDPDPSPTERVRLFAARAFAWHPTDPDRCLADTEEAERATPDDPLLRCVVLNARFWSQLTPARWDSLDEVGVALLAEAERAGSWGHRTVGHHARFLHATHRHRFAQARAHADAALAEAPDGQLATTLVWTSAFAGLDDLVAGRLDAAAERFEEMGAALATRGGVNGEALALCGLIGVRDAQGRLAELVPRLAAVSDRVPDTAADPLALALLADGRPDEARHAWRPATPVRRDWYWLFWTAMRARVAVGLDDRDVARAVHADLAPWSGHLGGALSGTATLGPVDLDLLALEELLGLDPPVDRRAVASRLCDDLGARHWLP